MRWFAVRPKAGVTIQQLRKAVEGCSSATARINDESGYLNVGLTEGANVDIVASLISALSEVQSVTEDMTPVPYLI